MSDFNTSWSRSTKSPLESLQETISMVRNQQYRPEPPKFDCIVTTKEIAKSIKASTRESVWGVSMSSIWDNLSGIPIYYYADSEEAKRAAMEMLIKGTRPFLVLEEKMSDHRKKIIDSLELNGELIMLEDGYQYFAPRSGAGVISARELRIIADELDRRNKEWDEPVKSICPPSR